MALKFLNKKGWHTGSLRNIENVWKAEQKHEAEQRKLEEVQKQIREEQDHLEFRKLQEQAGLVPKQERLDFLYESGLGVGKPSNDEYLLGKPLEESKEGDVLQQVAATPGSLFVEEKISANDQWRKIRSDPLLLIKQQELAARERIKNNPLKMEALRKEVELKKKEKEDKKRLKAEEKLKRKALKKKLKMRGDSEEKDQIDDRNKRRQDDDDRYEGRGRHREREYDDGSSRHKERDYERVRDEDRRNHKSPPRRSRDEDGPRSLGKPPLPRRKAQLTEEEKQTRLKEMQEDAELHEEQRWKRIKTASESDAVQEQKDSVRTSKNFLDQANRSVYGTDDSGKASVADTLHRRSHYREKFSDSNAFRRS